MNPIPAFDLLRQGSTLNVSTAVEKVLREGRFINGPEVSEFEAAMAEFIGVKHAIGCGNGTDALQLALMTCGIGPGDEVITTSFTFVATVETIAFLGATPVIADIDPETYNISPRQIEQRVTSKTRAVIPVHIFGQCAEMEPILTVAEAHHLAVIEDAAQAAGADYRGQKAGSMGTCGCFSFYPTKNLGAYGDGGLVTTNDDDVAQKIRKVKNHGGHDKYRSVSIGINSRLDTLQAAILLQKLSHLNQWNQRRREIARLYSKRLGHDGIQVPVIQNKCTHIFHQYSIQVDHRDELAEALARKGIGTMVYYRTPIHLMEAYRYLGHDAGSFPVAEKVSGRILSLPMFPELTDEEVEHVSEAVLETMGVTVSDA